MGDWLHKLDLSVRLLESRGKAYLARYIAGQRDTLARIQAGAPYVLCTYYVPPELLRLFNVEVLYIERVVGLAVSAGLLTELSQALPVTLCSYQKAFAALMEQRVLPRPVHLIALEFPCPDAVALMTHLHQTYRLPIKVIRRQSMHSDLMDVVTLLHKRFSRRHTAREVSRLYNQANKLKRQIDNLRWRYPGLADSADLLKLFPIENDFGSEQAVTVLQSLRDDLLSKTPQWQPPVGCRVLWMGLVPLYDNSVGERLEKHLPVRSVWEEMWSFDRPDCTILRPEVPADAADNALFAGLAHRIQASLFYRPQVRCNRLLDQIDILGVQLVIAVLPTRCSFLPRTWPLFRAAFEDRGIPCRAVAWDVVVKGTYAAEALSAALEDGLRAIHERGE